MCIGELIGGIAGIGGSLLSGQGQANNAIQQIRNEDAQAIDNANAAVASNQVLQKFLTQQGVNQAANQTALKPEYAAIQPEAFQASQAAIAGANNAAAQGGITHLLSSAGPQLGLTGTDNGQSAKAIQDAQNRAVQLSRNKAADYANLAAFGQNFQQLGRTEMNTNEKIDATNNNARIQAGILPYDEQNAALQARHFIPPADTSQGNTMSGIGNFLASNASGIGNAVGGLFKQNGGIGSIFGNFLSPANPTLNVGDTFAQLPDNFFDGAF